VTKHTPVTKHTEPARPRPSPIAEDPTTPLMRSLRCATASRQRPTVIESAPPRYLDQTQQPPSRCEDCPPRKDQS
jgi:hypothetical protein